MSAAAKKLVIVHNDDAPASPDAFWRSVSRAIASFAD